MKKTKRLLALFLALAMMSTIMIATASAAVTRGRTCSSCGFEPSITRTAPGSMEVTVLGCSFRGGSHKHKQYGQKTTVSCPCGKLVESYMSSVTTDTCLDPGGRN